MIAKVRRMAAVTLWLAAVITIVTVWVVDAQQPERGGAPTRRTATGLYFDEGRGYIQERGGRIVELTVGDEPVWTPPNIEHWHGASITEGGTQVSLTCCGDNYVSWLDEEVTDEVYRGPRVPRKEATARDLHSMRR
jgi:hypothetical protein